MEKSKGQKVSESKRIPIETMKKLCLEIYGKQYVIKSLSYIPKLRGGFDTILNCECKKHKICFTTRKTKFLNANNKENRTSCSLCKADEHKERFNIKHYQKLVDKNKGKNVALVFKVLGNKLSMKCLEHAVEYTQATQGLKRCGCNKCLIIKQRNSTVTLSQVKKDIRKWGNSIVALKIIGNHNKLTGSVKNVLYMCTNTGHEGDIIKPVQRRLVSNPCYKCVQEAKSITHNQMVERAYVIHPVAYIYSKTLELYTTKDYIKFKCPICENWNLKSFMSHFHKKRGCKYCIRELNREKQIISDEKIYDYLKQVEKSEFSLTGRKNLDRTKKNLLRQFICEKHNEEFWSYTTHSYLKSIGCKICNGKSKPERIINDYLKMKKIDFEQQKRFKGCVNFKELPFDFYIPNVPSTNKKMLIEYDGGQHFFPVYGEDNLKLQVQRDMIKTAYAKAVGIELIRISYTQNKDIIQILDKILFNTIAI